MTMTSRERVEVVLDHRIPDRVPVALHNFLMACRMVGADLRDTLRNGEALAEAQLFAWREFGHDVIMHENGVCAEAEALGCKIAYHAQIPAHVEEPIIHSWADVDALEVPDPERTFPLNEMLKATRILVRETGGRVFVMGRADQGPMALAAALCGPEQFLLAAAEPALRPSLLRLCDLCSRMNVAYGAAQVRAGAHGTSLGAFGAPLISPKMFQELELPRLQTFCNAMRALGTRTFVHACGDESGLLEPLIRTGADCLELDPLTDPGLCKRVTQGRVAVLGMLDAAHILHRGDLGEVRRHTEEILGQMAPGGGFILGPGCALPGSTREEVIHTVMACAKEAGQYPPDVPRPSWAA